MNAANSEGLAVERHKPSWKSLKQHKVPEWFKDAKFGVFTHWGVYAVRAAGNEWYPHNMYLREHVLFKHHRERWGDQSEFEYQDFIPMFKAEKWDPDAGAELFKKSGARFLVPVSEHHDCFGMYDSSHAQWDSLDMGP